MILQCSFDALHAAELGKDKLVTKAAPKQERSTNCPFMYISSTRMANQVGSALRGNTAHLPLFALF